MKQCKTCSGLFDFSSFPVKNKKSGALIPHCRPCWSKYRASKYPDYKEKIIRDVKKYAEKNKAKVSEYQRQYRTEKAAGLKQYIAGWYQQNRDQQHQRWKESYQRDPAVFAARARARQATKLRAIPSWNAELDQLVFAEAYDVAAKRKLVTGFAWQVDHVVPLKSKKVCGLHTHTNVAVIPATVNRAKSNSYWPGMW